MFHRFMVTMVGRKNLNHFILLISQCEAIDYSPVGHQKSARFFCWGSILLFQATTNAPTPEDVSASGIKKTSAQSQSHHYIFRHFFFQASTPRRCGLSLACRQSDLQQKCHRLSRVLWMRRTQRGPSPGCLGYIIQKSTLPKLT